jgi:hypothetical protein
MHCQYVISSIKAMDKIVNLKRAPGSEEFSGDKMLEFSYWFRSGGKPILVWESRDRLEKKFTSDWYIVLYLLFGILLIYALLTFNFMLAILSIVSAIALGVTVSQKPVKAHIGIFSDGVEIEGLDKIEFTEIESFWIFTGINPPMLVLRPRYWFRFPAYILLENIDPEKVREVLLNYLPEREEELPFVERISQLMGF